MLTVFQCFGNTCLGVQGLRSAKIIRTVTVKAVMDNRGRRDLASSWKGIQLIKSAQVIKQTVKMYKRTKLKKWKTINERIKSKEHDLAILVDQQFSTNGLALLSPEFLW